MSVCFLTLLPSIAKQFGHPTEKCLFYEAVVHFVIKTVCCKYMKEYAKREIKNGAF